MADRLSMGWALGALVLFTLSTDVQAQKADVQVQAPPAAAAPSLPAVQVDETVQDPAGLRRSPSRRLIETGTTGSIGRDARLEENREYRSDGPQVDNPMQGPAERRLGNSPDLEKGPQHEQPEGLRDPLQGRGNSHPRSTLVGPGGMPSSGDLVQGEDVETIDTGDGGKIVFRHGQSSSTRVDYAPDGTVDAVMVTERGDDGRTDTLYVPGDDGSTYIRESHYDSEGNLLYDTESVRPGGPPTPNASMPTEDGGGSDGGGWYNPITGVSQGTGKALGGNRVRLGDGSVVPASGPTLKIDQDGLVTNPAPDAVQGAGTPTTIDRDGGRIVDPPRPPE